MSRCVVGAPASLGFLPEKGGGAPTSQAPFPTHPPNRSSNINLAELSVSVLFGEVMWVWVKITPPGDRLFLSWVPFARVPFWVPIFDPQPC